MGKRPIRLRGETKKRSHFVWRRSEPAFEKTKPFAPAMGCNPHSKKQTHLCGRIFAAAGFSIQKNKPILSSRLPSATSKKQGPDYG